MELMSFVESFRLSAITEWSPMNIMLAFLCIYSLIVNYSFGHPTYWRRSRSIGKLSTVSTAENNSAGGTRSPKHSSQSMELVLHNVDPDTLLHILSYLTPYDLTVTSQLSRSYREVSHHRSLWDAHTSQLPLQIIDNLSVADAKVQYFVTIKMVSAQMLRDNEKLVISLRGDLYDLTYFASEHPGGDAILSEYKGRDATVMFERVTHSATALKIRENLLTFSPKAVKGAAGWPKFCIQACLNVQ
jgi:cytochrome b involved in lipid metabolism